MVRNSRDDSYYLGSGEGEIREESRTPPPPQQFSQAAPPYGRQGNIGLGATRVAKHGLFAAGSGLGRLGLSLLPPSRPSSGDQSFSPPPDSYPPSNTGHSGGYQPPVPQRQVYYQSRCFSGGELAKGCMVLLLLAGAGIFLLGVVPRDLWWTIPVGIGAALVLAHSQR